MGLFKDFKNTMQAAGDASNAATALAQAQTAAVSGAANPNFADPAWAPIVGVSIDDYARVSALLAKSGAMGPEAVNAFVESQGVPVGAWQQVQTGWVQRMSQNQALMQRYGVLYSQF